MHWHQLCIAQVNIMAAVAYQLALIPQKCLQQCIEATPLCRLQNAIAMCLVMWECRPVSKIFVWNYVSPWTKAALLDQWRNPLYAMVVFFVRKILLLWYSVIHFITFFKDIFMYVFFCIKCQLIRLFFFSSFFFFFPPSNKCYKEAILLNIT